MLTIQERVAKELGLGLNRVQAVLDLLEEGSTVPFIARYRKEATGSMDEVAITNIRDRAQAIAELEKRRSAIVSSLQERELLTEALEKSIAQAETLSVLEDLYLPYRPKRNTRASQARSKGLEPLAVRLMKQAGADPVALAAPFIDEGKGVTNPEEALAGARDIIAESVSEHTSSRATMRRLFERKGVISSTVVSGKEEAGQKYRDYFEQQTPVWQAPSHRILALFRGEKEGVLSLNIAPPKEEAIDTLERTFVRGRGADSEQVRLAVGDGYQRLLAPSMETELRNELKKRADTEAIRVFADNVREVLMGSPLGQKRVLALDPGFRTGCKVVCLDAQGRLLHNTAIFPHPPQKDREKAAQTVRRLVGEYGIEAIAIGNGTAGRETESFVRELSLPDIVIVSVNESGASIYSASAVAREEFPEQDVTVRGAVSIGRRLQDPMAELVKIDPKSIGVGQYQHDVDQKGLKGALDDVVEQCVNRVGVEVNSASKQLLTYVSGLGPTLASNIIVFREQEGPFTSRAQLKKVPRLGPKAFEQAAGFLRIHEGKNPLDASAVHPENYALVERMCKDLGCTVRQLMGSEELRGKVELEKYVDEKVGLPTLHDIMAELAKPGRDPRAEFEAFAFAENVHEVGDLKKGMELPGIVTNVTAFGAFVDVGVHQDGLVHKSKLRNKTLKPGQHVAVEVVDVDLPRNRIALALVESVKKAG